MYRVTKVLNLAEGADSAAVVGALDHAGRSARVLHFMLQPTLPQAANGGDFIWYLQFAGEPEYRAWLDDSEAGGIATGTLNNGALVSHVDSVCHEHGRAGSKGPFQDGVYRSLMICINNAPDEAAISQFEFETYEMGLYIPGIVRWRISRVSEASGARPWTHLWEQEYRDIDGLLKSYMLHPHHWAWINRWYDPECVEHIVDSHQRHSFCNVAGSVILPEGLRNV